MADRAIIWDLDGTLVDMPQTWPNLIVEALDEITPGHGLSETTIGENLRQAFPWHFTEPHTHLKTPDAWWGVVRDVVAEALVASGLDAIAAKRAGAEVRPGYLNPKRFHLLPHAREVLTKLLNDGWRHHILSNHVPEISDVVEGIGIGDLIDTCTSAGNTGYEKPHPLAFKAALDAAGHPDVVWMVGDSPAKDVLGAEAMGMRGILVHTPPPPDIHRAARDLPEVERIISSET